MKTKFIFVLVGLASICVFTSCKNKKPEDNVYLCPPAMDFSKDDSTQIKGLAQDYANKLATHDFAGCAEMLYTEKNDSVHPYSVEEKAKFTEGMASLPIFDCKLKRLMLRSDKNNSVDLSVLIIPNGDIDNNSQITTITLNPVLFEGKWYLTLRDMDAEGVENIYEEPKNAE